MDWSHQVVTFLLEEAASHGLWVIVSLALGVVGSKWYFGRKNHRLLTDLQAKVRELEQRQAAPNSQPSVQPSVQPDPKMSEDSNRVWSPLSLQDLVKLMEEKTQYAADKYKGQWLRVEGNIEAATEKENQTHISVRIFEKLLVHLYFDSTFLAGHAASIETGKYITAAGKLDSISYSGGVMTTMFYLEECELLGRIE